MLKPTVKETLWTTCFANQTPPTVTLYTEDTNGTTVQLEAAPRRRYKERFLTMFMTTTQTLAGFDRPPAYHRALLTCLTMLDPIQFRKVSAREIAEASRLSVVSATRALAMLEADRVLITNGEQTAAKARRLNNTLGWASTAHRHGETTPDPEIIDARGC